ncbi:MAG: hypothetical protein ACLFQA_02925 [Bacteroidales bacterium]
MNRKVMVFLFFLLLSTIFWFLNALGREYTAELSYPVKYTNFPEDKVMVGDLPPSLQLTVNSHGYTLLKHYVSRRLLPIVFDVNSFSLNKMPDTEAGIFYILSSTAANRIAGQLGADIEILDVQPDTLFFRFSEMVSTKLPVKPVIDLQFERQFMIKGNLGVEPDSVTVSGPGSIVDTMEFVQTLPFARSGINEPVKETVGLADFTNISLSHSRVTIEIPVEQFTESSVKIPIETVNLPDSLAIKIFPSEITVSYMVALSDYERVSVQQFRAAVDYNDTATGNGRLVVQILKQPEFIRGMRFYPRTVDYIIER